MGILWFNVINAGFIKSKFNLDSWVNNVSHVREIIRKDA